jgi:hypothetical protein
LLIVIVMAPRLRTAPKKTARATQGDEVGAAQAKRRPAGGRPATQPAPKRSEADEVIDAVINQTEQARGLRAIRLRLTLNSGIRKSSQGRSRSTTPNRPLLSAQLQARIILSTSLTATVTPPFSPSIIYPIKLLQAPSPSLSLTPRWRKSISLLLSYVDPNERRSPPRLPPAAEEEEEEDDKIENIEDKEQAREKARIYRPYTIEFVTKLGKVVYYTDAFTKVNNFDFERIYRALFNKIKRTINLKTHEVI